MALIALYLGLQPLPKAKIPGVNALSLLFAIIAFNLLIHLSGYLDTKENRQQVSLVFMIGSVIVAAIAWVVMALTDTHASFDELIFFLDLVLSGILFGKTYIMLKNMWRALTDETGSDDGLIAFPGDYVLPYVHIGESLNSPFGRVLIMGNVVLFVVVNNIRGFVMIDPRGKLDVRKGHLLSDKTESVVINTSEMLITGSEGISRVMNIVQQECARRGVPMPNMRYDFALFLPQFERSTYVFDEDSFKSIPFSERKHFRYKNYIKEAALTDTDLFCGKACLSVTELKWAAAQLGRNPSDPPEVIRNNAALVADCIAKVCDLVEVNPTTKKA